MAVPTETTNNILRPPSMADERGEDVTSTRSAAWSLGSALLAIGIGLAGRAAAGDCSGPTQTFRATAYTVRGETAGGTNAKEGIVAADPKLLPLGSRIRLCNAGEYSGIFVVKDKGRAIHGHEIDVFLKSARQAKAFGKRRVKVAVLEQGEGTRAAAQAAPIPSESQKAPALR